LTLTYRDTYKLLAVQQQSVEEAKTAYQNSKDGNW